MQAREITNALAAPFEPGEVKFKPQSVKGNRALALAYLDCRVVQDRLDEVCGVEGWMDEYHLLPDGSVMCKLQLNLGGNWVTKSDVGSMSEQPDGGDRMKAAFSDALKRAAVKFGVGRYLYRLTAVWADYDPMKKQFTSPPQLPAFARPKAKVAAESKAEVKAKSAQKPPATGAELHDRLMKFDTRLAEEKKCQIGDLLSFVTQEGVRKGYSDDMTTWEREAIDFATSAATRFIKRLDAREPQPAA